MQEKTLAQTLRGEAGRLPCQGQLEHGLSFPLHVYKQGDLRAGSSQQPPLQHRSQQHHGAREAAGKAASGCPGWSSLTLTLIQSPTD